MAQRPQPSSQERIKPRLSAPLTKLRKQWLTSVKDLDPQAALAVLRTRLQSETDGAVRLGNMAAQSWLVRQRLIVLQATLHGGPLPTVSEVGEASAAAPKNPAPAPEAKPPVPEVPEVHEAADSAAPQSEDWTKLRILAETEVNGMRFFAGTTIQVHEEDARKLIEAKSAERVEATEGAAADAPARGGKKAPSKN